MTESIQFQLNRPIKDKSGEEVTILELKPFTIVRGDNAVTKAIYTLENIISGVYVRMGESLNDEQRASVKTEAEESSLELDADALIEDQKKGIDPGIGLKITVARYADDDEALYKIVNLMDIIAKKRKKDMFFIDDRPMTDLEYDLLSFRDHENLMLDYLANFILTS